MGRSPNRSTLAWDADGVVIDSAPTAWRAAEDLAGLFGKRPSIASPIEHRAVFGRDAQDRLAGEDGADALRAMHRVLMRHRAGDVALFDEALAVAARLELRPMLITAAYAVGVRLALGSQIGIFSDVVGREAGPKTELIATAARNGVGWFITDTVADLHRCRACGVRTIAVAWGGYDTREALARMAPDFFVETPRELAETLSELAFLQPETRKGSYQ